RGFARDERAILRAIAARVPPRAEMLVTAEFGYVDRARTRPMLFEAEIGEHAGSKRERDQHQQDRAPGNEQRPLRTEQLDDGRDGRRQGDERDQPDSGVPGAEIDRIVAAPKTPARRVEERTRKLDVELRPNAEDQAHGCPDDERNHEADAVHECRSEAGLSERRSLRLGGLLPADLRVALAPPQPIAAFVAAGEHAREHDRAEEPAYVPLPSCDCSHPT